MKNCITIPSVVRGIVTQMTDKFPEEMKDRDGGHLILQEVGEDVPFHSIPIRMHKHTVSAEDFERYEKNAREKAIRLAKLATTDGHISTWQSRDFDNGKYGGGVEATGLIIAFSGLPEHLDEYLAIQVGLYFNRISSEQVKKILEISENPHR